MRRRKRPPLREEGRWGPDGRALRPRGSSSALPAPERSAAVVRHRWTRVCRGTSPESTGCCSRMDHVTLRGRTLARLTQPFEGGGGPSHSSIDRLWMSEDAAEYLPAEGNKADRVMSGLKALRDGRRQAPGQPELPPDHAKLQRVATELAETLVAQGLVDEADVAEALAESASNVHDAMVRRQAEAATAPTPAPEVQPPSVSADGPIFVVHGHADALRHELVRVLERATDRDVIVLHEQANAGRTILEKFEAHAASAAYAVVLLTGDDAGGPKGGAAAPRGRQNVIFELGFFFGKLGRERVAVLLDPQVEQPSDIAGLVYIPADPHGAWKQQLARELSAVDISVNYNRIP